MNRNATSAAVLAQAAALVAAGAVAYIGSGRFAVNGRSDRYTVSAPHGERSAAAWSCDCRYGQHGGRLCSHVRAADLWLTTWQAGQEGAAA